MTNSSITFPTEQNFACSSCGKCCRTDWRIVVHSSESKKIEETSVFQDLKRDGYEPLRVMGADFELGRRDDKTCTFLNENTLCQLHTEAGPETKPAPCRTFPYQVVSTPGGYYSYLSFSCPAVVFNSGPPVADGTEDLLLTMTQSPHFFSNSSGASETVQITGQSSLSWIDYLELEDGVLKTLRSGEDLKSSLVQALASHLISPSDPGAVPYVQAAVEHTLPTIRNLTIATLEECEDLGRRMEILGALSGEIHFSSNLLGKAISSTSSLVQEVDTQKILQRFVAGQIEGKRLLTGPNFMVRLLYLLVLTEVFWFYLDAQKMLSGEEHSETEAIEHTFDLIETQALHHFDLVEPILGQWSQELCLCGSHSLGKG